MNKSNQMKITKEVEGKEEEEAAEGADAVRRERLRVLLVKKILSRMKVAEEV